MEIESVQCECCGLGEDCTQEYINSVKLNFDGKWLCGLCTEAVRDEVGRVRSKKCGVDEALGAHMSFCRNFRSNPAVNVADGMKVMLRRQSGDLSTASGSRRVVVSSKKIGRSISTLNSRDENVTTATCAQGDLTDMPSLSDKSVIQQSTKELFQKF